MILNFEHITKNFGKTKALNDVSLGLEANQIYGLIGPDGAGKTTLMRTLVTLLKPDQGQLFFKGTPYSFHKNVKLIRKKIGYMPQRFSLYPDLTVEQNLHFFGDLFSIPKIEQAKRIERLFGFSHLEPFKTRLSGNLSGGMKQKLALMCVLIHEPEVLVLDEPTVGVDPVSRHEFWQILHNLVKNNTTIFVSTSYMNEAEECQNIALIYQGQLLKSGPPKKLVTSYPYQVYNLTAKDTYDIFQKLQTTELKTNCQLFGSSIHIKDLTNLGLEKIKLILKEIDINSEALASINPSLEDLFLSLLQNK